jgi:protoporphyrinogen IX oxidase
MPCNWEISMKWVLAFHIITVVAWFAGLFYLPRLFVYHSITTDEAGNSRFKVMEHKLFYYIMTPAGIAASILGCWLIGFKYTFYSHQMWLHVKLVLVALLWLFHLYNGYIVHQLKQDNNPHSERFYRFFNEIPTLLLMAIVILSIVKPF